MKRYIFIIFFGIAFVGLSCNNKNQESDKVPAEVKEAEMKDSTRLDAADDSLTVYNSESDK